MDEEGQKFPLPRDNLEPHMGRVRKRGQTLHGYENANAHTRGRSRRNSRAATPRSTVGPTAEGPTPERRWPTPEGRPTVETAGNTKRRRCVSIPLIDRLEISAIRRQRLINRFGRIPTRRYTRRF